MPTYEYVCRACGHKLELYQSMTEAPKRKCPSCAKQKLQRLIGTGAAILFKGSGFYQTDYRSTSYTEGAKKDAPAEPAKPDGAAGRSDAAAKTGSAGEPSEPVSKRAAVPPKSPKKPAQPE